MTRLDLDAVKEIVDLLCRRIDAPARRWLTFGFSDQEATPHVEVNSLYHYVVCERGRELRRYETVELDLLLYWIFTDITFQMACTFELDHRRAGEDGRRQIFAKQEELMGRLSQSWMVKRSGELRDILIEHPFRGE